MNNDRQVDVGTLLGSISEVLQQNQDKLNEVDTGERGGTHGDRIAAAFRTAAEAASNSGTNDAGEQLAIAAQAMRENGQGRAVGHYANGLQEAAQQFGGRNGISISDVLPFLQNFLGGVRRDNPAQPGQGTMIDALLPAVTSLMGNKRSSNPQQSILEALGSAVTGARGTAGSRGQSVDPGAASATGILGGIVKALLPGIMGAVVGGIASRGRQQPQSQPQVSMEPGYDTGGYGNIQPQQESGGGLGDLLGQITGGGGGRQTDYGDQGGGGGLGDLLGGLLGGGGEDSRSTQQPQQEESRKPGWWPF